MKVIVVGSVYTKYLHDICKGLYDNNIKIDEVLLGSRIQRILFKLDSLKRVIKKNGLLDALRRYHLKGNPKVFSSHMPLKDIQNLIGFNLHHFNYVNSGEVMGWLSNGRDDQVVVLAGCGIVDQAFLECSGGNCINGHPAWLPGYRGVDVVEWSLLNNKDVGVSSHFVIPKVDAGSIIIRKKVPMKKHEDYTNFRERVNEYQADVVVEAVKKVIANDLDDLIENDILSSKMCYAAPVKLQKKARKIFSKIQKGL